MSVYIQSLRMVCERSVDKVLRGPFSISDIWRESVTLQGQALPCGHSENLLHLFTSTNDHILCWVPMREPGLRRKRREQLGEGKGLNGERAWEDGLSMWWPAVVSWAVIFLSLFFLKLSTKGIGWLAEPIQKSLHCRFFSCLNLAALLSGRVFGKHSKHEQWSRQLREGAG